MYTIGDSDARVQAYIDWCLSPAGQKIVEESGYVPVGK
jgi:ABC-type phosphate transport system substrate-binding protein